MPRKHGRDLVARTEINLKHSGGFTNSSTESSPRNLSWTLLGGGLVFSDYGNLMPKPWRWGCAVLGEGAANLLEPWPPKFILIVILVLALIGALPTWPHSRDWATTGGLGVVNTQPQRASIQIQICECKRSPRLRIVRTPGGLARRRILLVS